MYIPHTLSQESKYLYEQLKELGYELYNISNKFYQDICTPYKSSNGTDVMLSDRINYYYYNNEIKCQSNCEFSNYYIEAQYLKCKCDPSNSEIDIQNNTKFNPKTIYKSFYDILKFSNYKVLKCYKLIFIVDNLKNNIGNIISAIFIFIYLIFIILYLIKGNNEIIKNLKVIKNLTNRNRIKEFKNIIIIPKNDIKFKENSINNEIQKKKKFKKRRNNSCRKKSYHPRKKKLNLDNDTKILFQSKNNFKIISNREQKSSNILINSKKPFKKSKSNNLSSKGIKNYKEKLDNYELNNLEYKEAIKLDKRKIIEIYWPLLKREHLILFTFCNINDYNIIYIKYIRLILFICTDMALNVFFFADETMHKMFLDYGKYNFIQQIPQIIYSTIVSQAIQVLINYLSLIDKHFYEIKKINTNKEILKRKIIKCIKLKINFFLLFTFFMLTFYWYIISCFCAVYKNTQIAFVKDSAISFCLELLYPFIWYIFPSLLRRISLKFHKKRLSCIYKISDFIPLF